MQKDRHREDGLRSLLRTCKAPDMVEKTMRYPGHAVRMRILREAGFSHHGDPGCVRRRPPLRRN